MPRVLTEIRDAVQQTSPPHVTGWDQVTIDVAHLQLAVEQLLHEVVESLGRGERVDGGDQKIRHILQESQQRFHFRGLVHDAKLLPGISAGCEIGREVQQVEQPARVEDNVVRVEMEIFRALQVMIDDALLRPHDQDPRLVGQTLPGRCVEDIRLESHAGRCAGKIQRYVDQFHQRHGQWRRS